MTGTADDVDEGDGETVRVSGSAHGFTEAVSATVTITDDDVRGVVVSANDVTLRENGSVSYTVVLATRPTGEVTVRVGVTGDGDVTARPSVLVFDEEDWNESRRVTVTVDR